MKKIFFVLLSAWLSVAHAAAIGRSAQVMREIATRQLQQMGLKGTPVLAQETETYAIYRASVNGFVVVGKSSDAHAVLGYSKTNFNADRLPCGLKWWLAATDATLKQEKHPVAVENDYIPVDNFLPTRWGQDFPYNYFCPKVAGEGVPCGCVATAMSQVLRYFAYPTHAAGYGDYSLTYDEVDPDTGAKHTVSQSYQEDINSDYDWLKIPYEPTAEGTSEEEQRAVGQLVYDCGRAVSMQYAPNGSGAYSNDAALAMSEIFGYNADGVRFIDRDYYSDEEWMSVIAGELSNFRPIIVGASDVSGYGGHEFLFSGIDASGNVYVNWGWNGDCDGFYSFDMLNPTGTVYGFNAGQEITYGFYPQTEPVEGIEFRSEIIMRNTLSGLYISSQGTLTTSTLQIYNFGQQAFDGTIGLLLENTAEGAADRHYYEYTSVRLDHRRAVAGGRLSADLSDLPAGTYRARMVAKDVRDSDYRPIRATGGRFYERNITKTDDGTYSVSAQTTAISNVRVEGQQGEAHCYDLQGRRVGENHRGLTIVRKNGKATKVMR